MSKTKRCPACQRELPLLAVRCKYCGFKLSSQPSDESEPAPRPSAPPPPPPGRPSAPPPPPPKRISTPPPAPAKGAAKRTMMMGTFAPPVASRPAAVEAAFASPDQSRTQELGTARKAGGPVGIGQTSAPAQSGERTTLPPPPMSRPPSAPPLSTPPAEPEPLSGDDDLVLDTGDLADWIPGAEEVGDDTSLIDLDSDDVEELVEQAPAAPPAAPPAPAAAGYEEDEAAEEIEPSNFFFKYILVDETLDGFEARGWPAGLVKVLGKLRWVHAIGAGVVLVGLIALIIGLAVSGEDEPEQPEGPPAVAEAPPEAPPGKPTEPKVEEPVAKGPDTPPAKDATPPATQPDQPIPDAGKTCRPLADYPDFPWKKLLTAALGKVGGKGVCDLFGASPATLADAFAGKPQVGPGGYDLLKGGGLLEVFPVGEPDRRGPSMEYLFVGDKLYEVRFNYWDTAKKLEAKAFGEVFEEPDDKPGDHLGRKLTEFVDGDVAIDVIEEKWYGRKLTTLALTSVKVRAALAADLEQRNKAEKLIAEGEALFGSRKYEDAIAKFDEASKTLPRLGKALVKKALALTRTEDFEGVEAAARKVLEISREQRTRAEAYGLIALAALFNGDKDKAIAQFKAAAEADLANSLFAISYKELETGEYEMARVALTAARMECLTKKKITGTDKGLLARGNFPDFGTYFKVMRKAKRDPKFDRRKSDYLKYECR